MRFNDIMNRTKQNKAQIHATIESLTTSQLVSNYTQTGATNTSQLCKSVIHRKVTIN